MDFTPRNYQDITSGMAAYLAQHPALADGVLPSDLTVGSLERAQLEASALMMEEYDQRAADGIANAISESCYKAFGFSKLPAKAAVGAVVCSSLSQVPYDTSIPIGTTFQGPNGVLFKSTEAGSIPSGTQASGSIPIVASVSGVDGNVAEGTITKLVSPLSFVDHVTNTQATIGGSEEEADSARALRFQAYIRTIQRGTKEALEFAALSSTGVTDARAVEPFLLDPVPDGVPYAGRVWLFCDDGTMNPTLSAGVVTEVSNFVNGYVDAHGNQIPGYKASGIIVDILKSQSSKVRVRGTVKIASGAVSRWSAIKANLTAAVVNYFASLRIAESASYQNLVTTLTICDDDIREVKLVYWLNDDPVPDHTDAIVAKDMSPYSASNPLTVGARLRPLQGAVDGVTYPEWVLG